MIVLRERNNDFQVGRTSSLMNLFSLGFILGDSTKVQTMPISGPFFFNVKPEKCGKNCRQGELEQEKELVLLI